MRRREMAAAAPATRRVAAIGSSTSKPQHVVKLRTGGINVTLIYPCGWHAQWLPQEPDGLAPGSPVVPFRVGAATIDSSLVNCSLPHLGQAGCVELVTS